MKKLLALLIVLTMIIGIMPVVSAAIPQNNGKGTVLELSAWSRNAPSSGTWCGSSTYEDEEFGTVFRYTTTGSTASKSYTTYQYRWEFPIDESITVTAGDKVFVSYYYKINTTDGTNTYVAPATFTGSGTLNRKATTGRTLGDVSITDQWVYVSYITTIYSTPDTTEQLRQWARFTTTNATDKICVDITDVQAVYLGAVTDEDGATADEQIASTLSTTSITGISIGDTPIDLTANPTSYTSEEAVSASDVTVTTTYGVGDKVVIEQGENLVNVKVYAPYIDWKASGATPSATYTINVKQKEPVSVSITENNGYGTGVIYGLQTPDIQGNTGKEYGKLETIKGDAAAPFDEYYSWTREEFTVEGTNNQNYLAFVGNLPEGASAGDWVYVSFYYRTYNRFTNSEGVVVDNNQIDLYPAIRSDGNDNPYYRTATAKYIRLTADTTAENDVGEWKKLTYIQKLDYDTNESWTLKLTSNHIKNSDGTVTGRNRKIDFADIKVAYFGAPTVLNAETDDEKDTAIKAAIEAAAGNYGITGVYIDGEEINIISNPLSYSVSAPRLTARERVFDVTADGIHGAGTTYVVESDYAYTIISRPLDFDWLSGTDNRVATYTVNDIREYDFYDFKLNGLTLTLKADNGLDAPKTGVLIGASYDAKGKLLKLKAEPFSISGNGNTLSVTIPESTETVASLKLFVWDGVASGKPYVNTIRVNDIKDGIFTQDKIAELEAE